jgi:glycosyltransferase involved in cell wall biosynthesis
MNRDMRTVSLLIFAYNHEAFIEEALRSAFDQTYAADIIVIDDGSADGTVVVIERVLEDYTGPKAVQFIKHHCNKGLATAINTAASVANGDIFVFAAGDDRSAPERVERVVEAFGQRDDVHCVFSNARIIGETGDLRGLHYAAPPAPKSLLTFAGHGAGLLGATASYSKDVFRRFEPLTPDVVSEDWVLSLRRRAACRLSAPRDQSIDGASATAAKCGRLD